MSLFRLTLLLAFITLLSIPSRSQSEMGLEQFMSIVRLHHPLAHQARLQSEVGEAQLLSSKGGFDPKISGSLSQKYFEGSEYYDIRNGGLKVPTWFGLELGAGYDQVDGDYANPQRSTPENGLWYAGAKLPIGKGLFIDERRAELKLAQVYLERTKAEQQSMLNKLFYTAGNAYWEWYLAHEVLDIYVEAVALAEQRFNAVKRGAELGDRPSIDTIEAGIQVQNRQLNLQEARLNYQNSTAQLAMFLWADGFIPLELDEETIPKPIDLTAQDDLLNIENIDSLIEAHPELRKSQFYVDQLTIDQRWKKEQLKPELNLKYNALSEPINNNVLADYSVNNYTWGVEFNMPILLMKERGDLKKATLYIEQSEMLVNDTRQSLYYRVEKSLNDFQISGQQITLYGKTVENYAALLNGERTLFYGGESSLFMVNSRELGYINAQVKLAELVAKNRKAELTAQYTLGVLN